MPKPEKVAEFLPIARRFWQDVRNALAEDPKKDIEIKVDIGQVTAWVAGTKSTFDREIVAKIRYMPKGSSGNPECDAYDIWISGIFTWEAKLIGKAMAENPPVLGGVRLTRLNNGSVCAYHRMVIANTLDMRGYDYPKYVVRDLA